VLITLAYPWNGYAPDETVDLEPAIAKQLLRDGKARVADDGTEVVDEPLEGDGVTIGNVKAYVAEHGGTLREVAEALRAEAAAAPASTQSTPPTGDDPKE